MATETPVSKLISCSTCSHALAFSADACPTCGAQNTYVHRGVQAFLAANQFPMRFTYRHTRLAVTGETADPQSKVLAMSGVLMALMALSGAAVFFFDAATEWLTVSVVAMALLVAVAPFLRNRGKRFMADFSSGALEWQSDDDKFWLPVWRVVRGVADGATTPPSSVAGGRTGAGAAVAALFAIALLAVGGYFAIRGVWHAARQPQSEIDAKTGGAASEGGSSTGSHPLLNTDDERAISAAKTLVFKNLKAPATARWVSATVVARKSPRFVVHVLVDAQNDFSALIRSSYLVAVALEGGEQFSFSPMFGMHECSDPPGEMEIQAMRSLNKWDEPSAAPPAPTASADALRYDPEVSTLTGVLEFRVFRNESDGSDERQLVLALPQAVRVAAGSDIDQPELEAVDVVTIVPMGSYDSLSAAQGRTATVRGRLFAGSTAHHHTPVLLGNAELVP
ncbi:MAG: DUF4431 domain-containing protein [Thermoanaerobaculia bacterium]|nr:DUF4431 domain-containing protein [Thermoanaerobaculia bacterium]